LGAHVAATAAGSYDYVGLPVFLSRAFRHSNIYIRTGAGIETPSDLTGKRIGVMDYTQTAGIWVRGLLEDDYGVTRQSIQWVTGGLNAPIAADRMALNLPSHIHMDRTSDTLNALLKFGEIDAIVSPQAPQGFREGHPNIRRLFDNYRQAEGEWFGRKGLFPIMHCAVVKRSVIAADPVLSAKLVAAFSTALDLAMTDIDHRDYPKIALPWLMPHAEALRAEMGNPWTYGLDRNIDTVNTFLRYCVADGLCDEGLTPHDVFQ
jgi:4,5-dihydroxyphthalate decarboxylase